MQRGKKLLAREIAVGDHAHKKRRHQRGNRRRAIREADLPVGEAKRLAQICPHRHEPHAPDEILEEHHRREPRADAGHLSSLIRTLRIESVSSWSPWTPIWPRFARP